MNECDQYKGRLRDLCDGVGRDGRPNPTQQASDRFRDWKVLPRIVVESPSARTAAREASQVGTRLSAIITERTGQIPCGPCKQMIKNLNGMTVDEIRRQSETIVDVIIDNAKKHGKWWIKLGVAAAESVKSDRHRDLIASYLEEACVMEDTDV